MNEALQRHLAPFHPLTVVFEAPRRPSFAIRRFSGLGGAFRLLWQARKNPRLLKAEQAYNEAVTAHSIGRFQQAEELYNTCTALQPDHEPAFTNLAALYLERNSYDLAIEELKKAVDVRPYYYRGYYNLGLIYRQMGRLDKAVAFLEQALQYNEKHFFSYVVLAEICAGRNDLTGAVAYYLRAEPLCTELASLHMRLAELYLADNAPDRCERSLRKALELKETPELHYNLGQVLGRQGKDPEHLVDCFLKACMHRKDFKEARFNLAVAQAAAGYHEQAVENIMKYVDDFCSKSKEEALSLLNMLREIHPGNHQAAMQVAQLYLDAGQVQRAVEVLSEVLKSTVTHAPAIQMLAEVYRHMGRHKDAIQTYRRLIDAAPKNVIGYLGLARAYGDIENFAAAGPVLKKVLDLDPNNADVHYQYATYQAQNGNLSLALKHYKRTAALDSEYPRIQKRLRMLEEELDEGGGEQTAGPWPVADRKQVANTIARENEEHNN